MWDQPETQSIMLPPDPLCKWLGHRWETMQELAIALERERRGQSDGDWWGDRNGDHVRAHKARDYTPSLKPRIAQETRIARAVDLSTSARRRTGRIEWMMSLACPKRKRYAA